MENNAITYAGLISGPGALGVVSSTGGGSLTLSTINTNSGGTNVTSGTLTVAASGAIGGGPLAVNAGNGITSLANFNNVQTVGGLSGTVSGSGSATVAIAVGAILADNQSTNSQFSGTLADSGTFDKRVGAAR